MQHNLVNRIEYLLGKAEQWGGRCEMVLAAHAIGHYRRTQEHSRICTAVDTSEVLKYVLPRDMPSQELKVSLELLFAHGTFPLYILLPHARELRIHLQAIDRQLHNFLFGTKEIGKQIREVLTAATKDLQGRPSAEICRELARVITERVDPNDALDAGTKITAWSLIRDLFEKERLQFVNRGIFEFEDEYEKDEEHYEACRAALTRKRGSTRTRKIQCDATALDYLRWINRSLPDHHMVILYTRTHAIFEWIEESRMKKDNHDYMTKQGVPLVQYPETALVYFGLFGGCRELAKHPEWRTLRSYDALARAKSALVTKMRLAKLQEWHTSGEPIQEEYVSDLEGRFNATEFAFQKLVNIALNTMLVNPKHSENKLYNFLTAPHSDLDAEELLRAFEDLLDEQVSDVEESRTELNFVVFPEAPWKQMKVAPRGESMLLSPMGPVRFPITEYVFQSPEVRELLEGKIENILGTTSPVNVAILIRRELFAYELRLKKDPEFYLLLSFVFGMCRDNWFEAREAARKGLRLLNLGEGELPDANETQKISSARAVTVCELYVAHAAALGRWGFSLHRTKTVAALIMSNAAASLRKCLQWREDNDQLIKERNTVIPMRDYRCLRELSFIYGSAPDLKVPLPLDSERVEKPDANHWRELRERALRYARDGLKNARKGSLCCIYLENNILYLLTKLASEEEGHLEERKKLARRLEASSSREIKEASICDTLSEHYDELARREENAKRKVKYRDQAQEYRRMADEARDDEDESTRAILKQRPTAKP